jgi:hypothetical protein
MDSPILNEELKKLNRITPLAQKYCKQCGNEILDLVGSKPILIFELSCIKFFELHRHFCPLCNSKVEYDGRSDAIINVDNKHMFW